MTLFSAKDLVCVVTGGGSGIGRMIAQTLATNGAKAVYIVGRRQEALEETVKGHANVTTLAGDVTSKDSLQAMVDRVEKEHGYLNLLWCNSGVIGPKMEGVPSDGQASIDELRQALWKQDGWDTTMEVNITSVFFTAVAFLTLLDQGNKKGNVKQTSQIITTSSIAGFSRQIAAGFAYSASKAGATHLAKCLGTYLAPYAIRSNLVCPGPFLSQMNDEAALERMKGSIPVGRTGSVEDMASVTLFLVSEAGAFVNGNALVLDGGRLNLLPATY